MIILCKGGIAVLYTGLFERVEKLQKPEPVQEETKRSNIPDSDFGLPSKRKYPMHDKKHVKLAVRMFNYVDKEDEEELAKNIIKKIHYYKMEDEINVGKDNRFSKYWKEPIQESSSSNLHPVFIVTTYTYTPFGKAVRAVTNDTYTHSSLGLDSSLSKLYSFNASSSVSINGRNGLSLESIEQYINDSKDSIMQVSAVFLKDKYFSKLSNNLDWLLDNMEYTGYDFSNILNVLTGRKHESDNLKMICSEFVDRMFKIINIDITGKSSNLVTPEDLSKITNNPKVYKLYEGKISDYNYKKIKKKIESLIKGEAKAIKEMVIYETKEFPVQFDADGNLIIKNYKTLDYTEEYYKSVKLLKTYKDTDNLEGMKYELAKLWFLSEVLTKRINSNKTSPEDKKMYLELKKKILNTFGQYLKIVSSKEKDFNFQAYYEETPFSDTKIKISGATLSVVANTAKKVIRI